MDYRSVTPSDYAAIRDLLAQSGWQGRVKDPEKFRLMLDNADRKMVVTEAGQIVGFARALCDDVSNGYLSMVVVAANWRGRGIGSQLVNRIMGDNPEITWVLRAGKGSGGSWGKLGFVVSTIAMERTRPPELEASE